MPHRAVVLEVIVTDAREAQLAARAGADRLELVTGIEHGGLTPDLATVREVVRAVDIPVHVMLRPHDRSFWYAIDERADNRATAAKLRAAGAGGIVFGALDAEGRVDLESVAGVAASATLPLTFHRAFDRTRDAYEAYAALSTLPAVTRVLTSGQAADAWAGRDVLRTLIAEGTPPAVVAGAGVSEQNLVPLVRATGAREVHIGSGARTDGRLDPDKIGRLVALLAQVAQAPS